MSDGTAERFGETLRRLREEAGLSQPQLARAVPTSQASLSRYESGKQAMDPATAARLDDVLGTGGTLRGLAGAATPRRDALRLGLVSVTPDMVSRVLREAGAEAAEFTRRAEASAVGRGVLEHLEMVVSDLAGSYSRQSPRELFAVAYDYRRRVDEMLRGPRTLSEARELYVYAGWLSESLAWIAHDLGDPLAADAYCVDAFEHAHQAGHDELCAWAMDARASIAMYTGRPQKALKSALAGIAKAPDGHPVAVRLHAQAARAHAKLGRSDEFSTALDQTRRLYERLPTPSPSLHGMDTGKLAAYASSAYAATSYLWLGRYSEAEQSARAALDEHRSASPEDRSPSREAIAKIDLAIALNGLGRSREAVQIGVDALESVRVVDSVIRRARELAAAMSKPGASSEFRVYVERFREVQRERSLS